MSSAPILYLGDTRLDGAASYVAGVLTSAGYTFDYQPSDESATLAVFDVPRRLFIFSDYPALATSQEGQEAVLRQVRGGSGLLMVGGWDSFRGMSGHWGGQALTEVLPVVVSTEDDRLNLDQAAIAYRLGSHPILDGLPWDERPPFIGGLNRLSAKADANTLLEARLVRARRAEAALRFEELGAFPLLVVGAHGEGRTAAFACDLAPHWVGPLVDWGTENFPLPSGGGRARLRGSGAREVEVGVHYQRFVKQLIEWTGRFV